MAGAQSAPPQLKPGILLGMMELVRENCFLISGLQDIEIIILQALLMLYIYYYIVLPPAMQAGSQACSMDMRMSSIVAHEHQGLIQDR